MVVGYAVREMVMFENRVFWECHVNTLHWGSTFSAYLCDEALWSANCCGICEGIADAVMHRLHQFSPVAEFQTGCPTNEVDVCRWPTGGMLKNQEWS